MGGSRKQVSFVPNSKQESARWYNYSPRLSRHVVFSPLKILVFYLPFRRVSWIEGAVRCTRGDMYLISSNKIINGVLREGRKLDSEGGGERDIEMGIPSLLVADVLENREMSFFCIKVTNIHMLQSHMKMIEKRKLIWEVLFA